MLSSTIFQSLIHGGSLTLYSSFWTTLILHLSIIWATTWVLVPLDTLFDFPWVEKAKAALFRGLFHINAAKKVATKHSMRWQHWCEPQSTRIETQQTILKYLPKKAKIQIFDRKPWPNVYNRNATERYKYNILT